MLTFNLMLTTCENKVFSSQVHEVCADGKRFLHLIQITFTFTDKFIDWRNTSYVEAKIRTVDFVFILKEF